MYRLPQLAPRQPALRSTRPLLAELSSWSLWPDSRAGASRWRGLDLKLVVTPWVGGCLGESFCGLLGKLFEAGVTEQGPSSTDRPSCVNTVSKSTPWLHQPSWRGSPLLFFFFWGFLQRFSLESAPKAYPLLWWLVRPVPHKSEMQPERQFTSPGMISQNPSLTVFHEWKVQFSLSNYHKSPIFSLQLWNRTT